MSASPPSTKPIQIEQEGDLTLVLVRPALVKSDWATTESAADEVALQLEPLARPRCVIDLSELDYLGSTQVAFIVRVWKSVRAADGRFAVVCPHAVVREVLVLAGLDKLLEILPTRDTAIQSVRTELSSLGESARTALIIASIIGGIAAAVALSLRFVDGLPRHVLLTTEYAGAAIGFVCGGILAASGPGRGRRIGMVVAVGTFLLLLTSLWLRLEPLTP